MAIADKLTYLNATKVLLREAITRAGHYLTEADPFRNYPYALMKGEHSLELDFLRGEYIAKNWRDGTASRVGFDSIITFTRGGGGRFNHLGTFEWVGSNVARIDHDPATVDTSTSSVTIGAGLKTFNVSRLYPVGQYVRATSDASNWVSGRVVASTGASVTLWVDRVVGTGTFTSWTLIRVLGLLVEESRTNLAPYSSDITNAAWLIPNVVKIAQPDEWVKVAANSVNEVHSAFIAPVSSAEGAVRTASIDAKMDDYRYVMLCQDWAGRYNRTFTVADLVSGTIYRSGAVGTGIAPTASMKPIQGGGFRVSLTAQTPPGGVGNISIWPIPDTGKDIDTPVWVGNSVLGTLVRRPQLEIGSFPTSHIPTTSSQVTRAADLATVADATDWRSSEGTLILEHDAPSTRQLLSSGANLLMTSQGTGKIAVAFTAGGSLVSYNGGTPVAGGALTFDDALKLMGGAATFANAHASGLQFIPRALTATELQAITS